MSKWIGSTPFAIVLSPMPMFVLFLVMMYRPEFGPQDLPFTILSSFLVSYGVVILAGLPAHLLLRELRRTSLFEYVFAFLLAFAALLSVLAVLDAMFGSEVVAAPDDNSPFATLRLADGGAFILGMLFSPVVLINAICFWGLAVRVRGPKASA